MDRYKFNVKEMGEKIKYLRKEAGIGQNQLADRQEFGERIVLRTMEIPLKAEFPAGASPRPTLESTFSGQRSKAERGLFPFPCCKTYSAFSMMHSAFLQAFPL